MPLLSLCVFGFCFGITGCSSDKAAVVPTEVSEDTGGGESDLMDGLLLDDTATVADASLEQSLPSESFPSSIRLREVASELGIDFQFDNGQSDRRLMPAATSGGCGWIDFDRDGMWDLFLPQGGDMQAEDWSQQPQDQLYRNHSGKSFINVAEAAGLSHLGYATGCSVADYDNDGLDDIYVTGVGPDTLWQNMGDGTFRNVTQSAGVSNPHWASSAAWGDLNSDGYCDIYVCNYVDYDPLNPVACIGEDGRPVTCHPRDVDEIRNVCFWNLGDGRFSEVSDEKKLNAPGSKSLGVVLADFDQDQRLDVYVANDTEANHLFLHSDASGFREVALQRGCAVSGLGHLQASMGVAFGDYDRNGFPDLYVTHFIDDSNTMYRNLGKAAFTDSTRDVGLHLPTLPFLGFGTIMADFDRNGWLDLFVANGHIDDWRERTGAPWKMEAQMLTFDGQQWSDVSESTGPYFQKQWLGRGVASCDFDNDGQLDLAILNQAAPVAVLKNESSGGHWICLDFSGVRSNRNGIGVQVELQQADLRFVQQLAGGTSYSSSHQYRLLFGLGQQAQNCTVTVQWPSGLRQTLSDLTVDRTYLVTETQALNSD